MTKGMIRVRISQGDTHYGDGIVAGAKILSLFGDVATELLIRHDGDEGLFVAYDHIEFKEIVRAGDYIEAYGEVTNIGNTSRKITFSAYKVIENIRDLESTSAARILDEPILVCRASGTCVVPKDRQRVPE